MKKKNKPVLRAEDKPVDNTNDYSDFPIIKVSNSRVVDLRLRVIQTKRRGYLDRRAHKLVKECALSILYEEDGRSTEDHLYARILARYPSYFPYLRKALNILARTGSGRVVSHLEHGERIYSLAELPK